MLTPFTLPFVVALNFVPADVTAHQDPTSTEVARGIVFRDDDGDGKRGAAEPGLAGVGVSNGRMIVTTDADGAYAIEVDDDDIVFVIKPRNYRTPFSEHMLPRFYYIHKPNGSPPSHYPGVAPTGPLPASIDFPLYPSVEPDQFHALLWGDPQPRNQQEVDWVARDVVAELMGTDASFGVTLGDIAFNNLETFEQQNRAIALLGIPWYNVIGNHDLNFDAAVDALSDETFERVYGPAYYSFDHGPVHFIVLDDVQWWIPVPGQRGRYVGGLGEQQMTFVRNDLARLPEEQLVVLMMHIPLTEMQDRQELYRLIENRKFCISISGHTHHHEHRYITKADGWMGPEPHHHIINVTVCGSWWSGSPDERGIPHTMMADGAPNGYSIIHFDGTKYRLEFRAAGRPASYQMNISIPEGVSRDDVAKTYVYANVFNASERSRVEMALSAQGPWKTMERIRANDPMLEALWQREEAVRGNAWRQMSKPKPSTHLWRAHLPADLPIGTHLIHVRETDENGEVEHGYQVFRVEAPVERNG
ncbi:MAG: calcineurin-like phosphoesterase C-terminal domain-containing protein [Planctomycetes bacterium]|nr:calcineurin-like phosphoesterase C-terminal domain-containing protein [Planctomycetota bacterium]